MSDKLSIVAISGSLRAASYNTRLLHVLKDMASASMVIRGCAAERHSGL
jgi:NAD(P)H-dependent FMN reductase